MKRDTAKASSATELCVSLFIIATLYAQKGEIVGIVGESGCSKPAFLKLLLRFGQKNSSEIAYSGVDIDKIGSDNLLNNVTMVSQATYLFDETIEDNLRIAKPDATPEEIESACIMASSTILSLLCPTVTKPM